MVPRPRRYLRKPKDWTVLLQDSAIADSVTLLLEVLLMKLLLRFWARDLHDWTCICCHERKYRRQKIDMGLSPYCSVIDHVRRDIDLPHGTLRWRKTCNTVKTWLKLSRNFYFVITEIEVTKSISQLWRNNFFTCKELASANRCYGGLGKQPSWLILKGEKNAWIRDVSAEILDFVDQGHIRFDIMTGSRSCQVQLSESFCVDVFLGPWTLRILKKSQNKFLTWFDENFW